jgi:hypothetical protein
MLFFITINNAYHWLIPMTTTITHMKSLPISYDKPLCSHHTIVNNQTMTLHIYRRPHNARHTQSLTTNQKNIYNHTSYHSVVETPNRVIYIYLLRSCVHGCARANGDW